MVNKTKSWYKILWYIEILLQHSMFFSLFQSIKSNKYNMYCLVYYMHIIISTLNLTQMPTQIQVNEVKIQNIPIK